MIGTYIKNIKNNGISSIIQRKGTSVSARGLKEDTFTRTGVEPEPSEDIKFSNLINAGISDKTARNIAKMDNDKYKKAMILANKNLSDENIEMLIFIPEKNFKRLIELLDKGISPTNALALSSLEGEQAQRADYLLSQGVYSSFAKEFANLPDNLYQRVLLLAERKVNYMHYKGLITLSDDKFKRAIYLIDRDVEESDIKYIANYNDEDFKKALILLHNGIVKGVSKIVENPNLYHQAIYAFKTKPNETRKFINSKDYNEKLNRASKGKYQKELTDLLSFEKMSFKTKSSLLKYNISEEDYFSAVQKLSKSTFKLALDCPNQYLSNIDTQYTQKVNGKYPSLPEEERIEEQKEIKTFFKKHMPEIIRAYSYLDTDTINQIMDKRTDKFEEYLNNLNELTPENYSLLSQLIQCKNGNTNKNLTAKEKIQLCQIVEIFQKCDINTSALKKMAKTGIVNINLPKQIINKTILNNAGITDEKIIDIAPDKLKLNEEYSYLTLMKVDTPNLNTGFNTFNVLEALSRGETVDTDCITSGESTAEELDSELYTIIKVSILDDFQRYITDTSNKYGKANAETEKQFRQNGLNYKKWINPDLKDFEFNLDGKKMKIKLWDRNPNEDLFMGNKTTCCTAIGTGINAAATPVFLTNTSFNVVDLYDENDNLVGLSRVFMIKSDGKPIIVMDNLEINNTFKKNIDKNDNLKTIRNNFFKYIREYAKQVTGEDNPQILISSKDLKVPTNDLKLETKPIDFIGAIAQNVCYFNSLGIPWLRPDDISKQNNTQWRIAA